MFIKAYDLHGTLLDHKTGIIGLPLYVLVGWYSKPEIILFAAQYIYTGSLLYYWYHVIKKGTLKLKTTFHYEMSFFFFKEFL